MQDQRKDDTDPAPLMSRSHLVIGLGYLGAYVLLDWVSFVHPFARFGVTPWNPQTGLSFALILLGGRAYLPWLFVAPLAGDIIVRGMPLPPTAEALIVLVTGVAYGGASLLLTARHLKFHPRLTSRRSLLLLAAVAIGSILIVATTHALVLLLHGFIPAHAVGVIALRAFVGDLIGVIVVTPFLLVAFTRRRLPRPSWEVATILLLLAAALWTVFAFAQPLGFQLFYLVFLPVVWIAVRLGIEGATLGLVVTQIGLIVVLELSGQQGGDVVAYQALLIILAVTALSIGVLVTEQQQTQQQLRLHQEAVHRAARLTTMGEFAAAVAHEINQPLTAIGNYLRLAKRAAERTPPDVHATTLAASEAIAQVERAGAVMHRLREFIRAGRVETAPIAVATLVDEALAMVRPELDRGGIVCETRLDQGLPAVRADRLQIEQVLLNLIRNAAEALAMAGRIDGRIVIEGMLHPPGAVEVRVTDNGPGFDPDLTGQPFSAFTTTKAEGLGLGLSLSRSIITAHGGQLRIEDGPNGVCAAFTLAVAEV